MSSEKNITNNSFDFVFKKYKINVNKNIDIGSIMELIEPRRCDTNALLAHLVTGYKIVLGTAIFSNDIPTYHWYNLDHEGNIFDLFNEKQKMNNNDKKYSKHFYKNEDVFECIDDCIKFRGHLVDEERFIEKLNALSAQAYSPKD